MKTTRQHHLIDQFSSYRTRKNYREEIKWQHCGTFFCVFIYFLLKRTWKSLYWKLPQCSVVERDEIFFSFFVLFLVEYGSWHIYVLYFACLRHKGVFSPNWSQDNSTKKRCVYFHFLFFLYIAILKINRKLSSHMI